MRPLADVPERWEPCAQKFREGRAALRCKLSPTPHSAASPLRCAASWARVTFASIPPSLIHRGHRCLSDVGAGAARRCLGFVYRYVLEC